MNKGYNELAKQKTTIFRRPPQVKSSKAQIFAKFHKIPTIRFEDQELTSFSGMIVFQILFKLLCDNYLVRLTTIKIKRNFA
jgi:hypothetical protein